MSPFLARFASSVERALGQTPFILHVQSFSYIRRCNIKAVHAEHGKPGSARKTAQNILAIAVDVLLECNITCKIDMPWEA